MQFDWWTLALQAVNFLVLVWLLQRFLFQPVRRLIETRKARSEELMRAAEGKLAESELEKARYEDLIASIEANKESTLKDFQRRLDADRDTALAKAHEDAETIILKAKEEIAKERRKAITASRADLVGLAKDIAKKILAGRAEVADVQSDVAAALDKLSALPGQERQRLLKGIESNEAGITVETSEELDDVGRNAITAKLYKELGDEFHVEFAVNPDLLGGLRIKLPQAELDASWAAYLDSAAERLLGKGDDREI